MILLLSIGVGTTGWRRTPRRAHILRGTAAEAASVAVPLKLTGPTWLRGHPGRGAISLLTTVQGP